MCVKKRQQYRLKINPSKKVKKKRAFADYIVFISIIMVTMFTVAAFVLQFKGLMEISATLTTCWFAFWTAEIVSLAAIKTSKVKNNYKKEDEGTENSSEQIESEENNWEE